MCPASSGQPLPALAYAVWLDALERAGWGAVPAAELAAVTDALGRVSAEPIVARWPSPRADCSAMDGIAVSAALLGRSSPSGAAPGGASAGGASAGGAFSVSTAPAGAPVWLAAGSFAWVDTGDAMPDGADVVVMREWLLPQEDGSVIIGAGAGVRALAPGKNVRRAAEDFAAGEVLVPAGRRLRPGDLAAAAAAGRTSVAVTRPPVAAIIPTGDEIRPVGSAAGPGEIFDTNSLMLAGRCRQVGAVPVVSAVQPDDPDALAAEIRRAALGADLVLVIAGSSRGRDDHAGEVLSQVGGVAVAGVAVRPGHPALLGHAKRLSGGIAPVIGLPGYPLATAVIFELFAAPLLAAIAGLRQPAAPRLLATLDRDWRSPRGIEDWALVTLTPGDGRPAGPSSVSPALSPAFSTFSPAGPLPVATPTRRGAGSISQLARADAWWPIPPDRVAFTAGATIEVVPIAGASG
jgi:putative molybdopterin biosynthesis protein